jgi:hypothetical protein
MNLRGLVFVATICAAVLAPALGSGPAAQSG